MNLGEKNDAPKTHPTQEFSAFMYNGMVFETMALSGVGDGMYHLLHCIYSCNKTSCTCMTVYIQHCDLSFELVTITFRVCI